MAEAVASSKPKELWKANFKSRNYMYYRSQTHGREIPHINHVLKSKYFACEFERYETNQNIDTLV